MTLGRTQCLYNVHRVAPSPHLAPSVLRFMLLFHVLSRICDICIASKWAVVWLTPGRIHLGLKKQVLDSMATVYHNFRKCSGRFMRTVGTFIPMSPNRLFPWWVKRHQRGSRLTRPPQKSTFASFFVGGFASLQLVRLNRPVRLKVEAYRFM